MKKVTCLILILSLTVSCMGNHNHYEIPIPTTYYIHPDTGTIHGLHKNYSCSLRPHETDTDKAVIHCFPTVDFLKEKILHAGYISCDSFPPGEILLGVIDNPKEDADNPYCFIWGFPPKQTDTSLAQPLQGKANKDTKTGNPVKKFE